MPDRDAEFQARLARNLEEQAPVLARLAESEKADRDAEMLGRLPERVSRIALVQSLTFKSVFKACSYRPATHIAYPADAQARAAMRAEIARVVKAEYDRLPVERYPHQMTVAEAITALIYGPEAT